MKIRFLTNGWHHDIRHTAGQVRIVSRQEGEQFIDDGTAERCTPARPENTSAAPAETSSKMGSKSRKSGNRQTNKPAADS